MASAAVRVAAQAGFTSNKKTAWSRLKSIPSTYPLAFGVIFSGCKTSFSDLLVQKVVERKEKVDWKRNAAFAAFGFIYLGGVQYALYVPIFSRLFPGAAAFAAKPLRDKIKDARGLFQLGAQVFIDQCVHHPLMYFPAFYMTKELVMHENPDVSRCLASYKANMKDDMLALWKIWVPATVVNFAFMPMYARIPFVAGVSLLWTAILSAMRGGDVAHGEEMAGGAVTGATLTMMEEGLDVLFHPQAELDPTMHHMMITASGLDKPGWVALLSRAVADAGGNVTHSRMVRLGSEFIVTMHVAVQPENQRNLVSHVKNNPILKGLTVDCNTISRRKTGTYKQAAMGVRVRCVGADKPGMLARISESLMQAGLSVESVTTDLQRHDRASERVDFVVHADCVTTSPMDKEHIENLVADLESLKTSLQLDVVDLRVQRLVAAREESSSSS